MRNIPKEAMDDRELLKVQAMIQSMTRQERRNPDIIDDSRIRRIAKGSGRSVNDVQSLYERFLQARSMMANLGNSGMMQQMMSGGGMGGMMGGMGGPMGGMGGPMGGMGGMMGGFPGLGGPTKKK